MASENLAADTETSAEENGISMVDVLREEEELEADATAVLGDSDVNNCTYPLGNVPRQALYACMTCKTSGPAGICLACSYECHEEHELIELYTKRNFCCDCGGPKFVERKCKLFPEKEGVNSRNKYNQNFKGVYCTCGRPYPDHEDEVEDEMIQCVVCEDWYHGRHLGSDCRKLPDGDDYDEMTCSGCVNKLEFLWAYNLHSNETQKLSKDDNADVVNIGDMKHDQAQNSCNSKESCTVKKESTVDETSTDNSQSTVNSENCTDNSKSSVTETCNDNSKSTVTDISPNNTDNTVKREEKDSNVEHSENVTETSNCDNKKDEDSMKDKENSCLLEELRTREITVKDSALFWKEGWRGKLCRCSACKKMYSDKDVMFLIDDIDTVKAYESRGKAKTTPSSQYDKGLQALSNMNRVQQVEVLQGFNDLKSELSDYLKKFAENGKVVREEDIREFFSQMEARKRQRTVGPMQYFCK